MRWILAKWALGLFGLMIATGGATWICSHCLGIRAEANGRYTVTEYFGITAMLALIGGLYCSYYSVIPEDSERNETTGERSENPPVNQPEA